VENPKDEETPISIGMWVLRITIFIFNIIGQSMQNICLPLALSGDDDMSVVLVYASFIYFCFFSILDVLFDVLSQEKVEIDQKTLVNVSFQNALNGLGAIFGGSSTRTPLTLQMSSMLLLNLLSPFYKMWVFGISFKNILNKALIWYGFACILYLVAFLLTLVDKIQNVSSGKLSPFALFFVGGVIFGMTYNVHQDKMMIHIPFSKMTLLRSFRIAVAILRKQLTWMFLFLWLSVAISFIPTLDAAGIPTRDKFEKSWADFLPFGNLYMDLFNLGYIISFVTSIFMNHYDSSFNMLTTNISAVLSLWTGWVPAISMATVGFVPNVPMTVVAIILSGFAVYPSYKYSLFLRNLVENNTPQQKSINQ